jgi:hypothetical protein
MKDETSSMPTLIGWEDYHIVGRVAMLLALHKLLKLRSGSIVSARQP